MKNKDNIKIKTGFLLSYDYEFLKTSIPLVYEFSDIIVLAKDYQNRTWSGNVFNIENSFFEWLKEIDIHQKIKIYEDDFYVPELSLSQNDTRERNMLAKYMGDGGWHIQLDSDEYFIDFEKLVQFLKSKPFFLNAPHKNPVNFNVNFFVLYKEINNKYLYSHENTLYPIATNYPVYTACRHTNGISMNLDFKIIHHSWARSKEEMKYKLSNWTHAKDFNTESYYNLWNSIDEYNYKFIKDFHPLIRNSWNTLEITNSTEINEMVEYFKNKSIPKKSTIKHMLGKSYSFLKLYNRIR